MMGNSRSHDKPNGVMDITLFWREGETFYNLDSNDGTDEMDS